MNTETVKLSQISVNNANPRTIKDASFSKLVTSLLVLPKMLELRPIVVDNSMTALGGNMRYRALCAIADLDEQDLRARLNDSKDFQAKTAAEQKKLIDYWLTWQSNPTADVINAAFLSDAEKREFIIKDNVSFGDWDYDALANEWEATDLDDWGVNVWQNEDMVNDAENKKEAKDDGFNEDDGIERLVQPGDMWQLGRHRLICGDSTKAETYQRLMNGVVADLTFTSPPYNAATTVTEKVDNKKKSKYLNDDDDRADDEYTDLLCQFSEQCLTHSQYVFVNIQSLSNNKLSLIDYLYRMKKYFADTIIWDKQTAQPAMAKNVLNSQFEYIHIFSNKANRAIGVKEFHDTIPNVLNLPAQHKNEYSEIHNATFPVGLVEFAVNNFCNDTVLDPFGGTGTTLIVCEQLGKTCFTVELQPHYCDLIIARWQLLTGEKAVKVG